MTFPSTNDLMQALEWNKGEYRWMSLGWTTALVTGAVYPAQALLFAYLVTALLLPVSSALQNRADFLSVWWVVIAIVEFIALFLQNGSFGYASEKMVSR
jgi:ATP-binding cassette subfamily B (MDR/TAP) protein 1